MNEMKRAQFTFVIRNAHPETTCTVYMTLIVLFIYLFEYCLCIFDIHLMPFFFFLVRLINQPSVYVLFLFCLYSQIFSNVANK